MPKDGAATADTPPGPRHLRYRGPLEDFDPENPAPFPENSHFRSERVLSESARELLWEAVMVQGLPLKAVSARYSVDVRRVAAVVRMMEVEKRWVAEVSLFSSFSFLDPF